MRLGSCPVYDRAGRGVGVQGQSRHSTHAWWLVRRSEGGQSMRAWLEGGQQAQPGGLADSHLNTSAALLSVPDVSSSGGMWVTAIGTGQGRADRQQPTGCVCTTCRLTATQRYHACHLTCAKIGGSQLCGAAGVLGQPKISHLHGQSGGGCWMGGWRGGQVDRGSRQSW